MAWWHIIIPQGNSAAHGVSGSSAEAHPQSRRCELSTAGASAGIACHAAQHWHAGLGGVMRASSLPRIQGVVKTFSDRHPE